MKLSNTFDFVLLSALWGGSYLFIRYTVGYIEPIALAEMRMLTASVVLGLLVLSKKEWRQQVFSYRKKLRTLSIVAFFNSAFPFAVITYSMQHMSAGVGAVINSTSPIWTAIVGVIWYRNVMGWSKYLGLVLGFFGIIFLMWGKASFTNDGLGFAILASMIGTFSYGISSNYIKHYANDFEPIPMTFITMFIGALMLLLPALTQIPTEPMPISAWAGMLCLGVGSTAIAYILFYRLATNTSATLAITVTFLVPVFGMLWGWLFLNETLTLHMMVGAGIVLLGTGLTVGVINFDRFRTKLKFL